MDPLIILFLFIISMAKRTKSEDPWSEGNEDWNRRNEVRSRIKYEEHSTVL